MPEHWRLELLQAAATFPEVNSFLQSRLQDCSVEITVDSNTMHSKISWLAPSPLPSPPVGAREKRRPSLIHRPFIRGKHLFSTELIWHPVLFAVFILLSSGPALFARDVFVMLSGGNSPFDNNYSQYLQARAVSAYFEKNYPPDSVWIFFGAGNVAGRKPVLADVRQETQRDGLTIPSWLPGALPHNLPARRSVFLNALHNEILPAIADGGTLFLFVGDHGSRSRGRNPQSEIDLWSLGPDAGSEHGWRENDDETLSVFELRSAFTNGIGKGRVVFCMTQCHAGGFHYLAIPHEMPANPKWFTEVPEWALAKKPQDFPNVAGFTATDEFSMAAGCDPDPDPARWAGYERFVPENLLGTDLFTLKPRGKCLPSFAEAHAAATLEDTTIDKPASTSEQYLERWSDLIEKRLATSLNLTGKVRAAITAYQRAVNGATPRVSDAAFKERQAQFRRFTEKLSGIDSGLNTLLLTGTRKQLEAAATPEETSPAAMRETNSPANPPRRGRGQFGGRRRLWRETIRPAWKAAVEAHLITNLPPATLNFEKHLLALEDDGENLFSGNGARIIEEEAYWESGFDKPETVNAPKAQAIIRWGLQRRGKILAWAKSSPDAAVREAATRLLQMPRREADTAPTEQMPEAMSMIDIDTAVARTLFYRRVLAAWEFLVTVNERPALQRLHQLIELERTPLPSPKP